MAGPSHRGLGLAFIGGELCFDGWTGNFHDIEPFRWEKSPPAVTLEGADQHVHATEDVKSPSLRLQLPRFNDARAIPDFRARDFRDSLKKTNSLMNQMDKRGAIAVRYTHSVGIDCLPMFGDWNTCHVYRLCHFCNESSTPVLFSITMFFRLINW